MKLLSILVVLALLTACTSSTQKTSNSNKDSSSAPSAAGADADEHGCRASTGFQWSNLREKCIKVFEEGIKLDPGEAITDKTTVAFVIFNDDNSKAEIFMPSETSSVTLERKGPRIASWNNGDWQLELKGANYILKKKDVIQYSN
jgi:hypothetical protein